MEFGLWEKYYIEILDDFGFSRENDEESAKLLDEILSTEGCLTLDDLSQIVGFSDKFIVFGAGPSLKEHILMLKEEYDLKDYVLVAADGATTALIEQKNRTGHSGNRFGRKPLMTYCWPISEEQTS